MDTETKLAKVKRQVIDLVPLGYYLVTFDAVWGTRCLPGDHEDCLDHGCLDSGAEYISDVDAAVNKVTKANYIEIGAAGMTIESNTNDRYDDTHDFRPRLFKTKREAVAHMEYTLKRFKNPQPWESFVRTA